MSDNTPLLTVNVLLEELKDVDDWYILGAYLNVPVRELKKIKATHTQDGVERCKLEMLQYWLDTTMTASWKDVSRALEQLNMLTLAARLKLTYLKTSLATTAESSIQTSPPQPDDTNPPSTDPAIDPSIDPSTGRSTDPTDISTNPSTDSSTDPSTDPSTDSSTDPSTSPSTEPTTKPSANRSADPSTDPSTAALAIVADVEVVGGLQDLESDFSNIFTDTRKDLAKCNVREMRFFLADLFENDEFNECRTIEEVLRKLRMCGHVDTFNVYYLECLISRFHRSDAIMKSIEEYIKKKEKFLKTTRVQEFQQAVVSRSEAVRPKGMAEVTIKVFNISESNVRTMKDVEKLAKRAFKGCHKVLVKINVTTGSIIITWYVPESLCEELVQLAQENIAVLREEGVEEVSIVGEKSVTLSTQDGHEVNIPEIIEQECAALKKVYEEFYHQLVDVLSDGDTHRSIVSDLHKRSVISEKVCAAQMTSTQERGRSLLTVLGLEEKPHKLKELITVMMEMEKVKTLAEEMTAQLSKSEQGNHTEQQHFEARIDQLTSDKKDLLTQLHYYKQELKAANELLIMREKVISSMMAVDKGPEFSVKMSAEQHDSAMADLNTMLKNTEEKLQSANKLLAAQNSELKEIWRRVRDLEGLLNVHFPSSLVQVTGEGREVAVLGQETTIQLSISSQDTLSLPFPIKQLSCQLTNTKSQRVPCHITHTQPGVCTLTFTPVLLCSHQLKITIRDTDIPGSPFTIRVLSSAMMGMAPENRDVVQNTIRGVKHPYGVAVSNSGEVVVSDYWNHYISVYSREEKHIRSFGSEGPNRGQFQYPRGVAITSDNHILIADECNHRIQMFTMEGRFVKSVGQEGKGQLQFNQPSGIAVHFSGRVFVVDRFNHRIQVLNPDLSYSHMFGSELGSAPGQFSFPGDVAINSSGVVYVTDWENHRVQLFSVNGQFLSSFGCDGSQHGQLYHPLGICVDSTNTVYVTDSNHHVSVYTSSGQFIKCFGTRGSGEGELSSPKGVAVDNTTGALYVCDWHNSRVVVY